MKSRIIIIALILLLLLAVSFGMLFYWENDDRGIDDGVVRKGEAVKPKVSSEYTMPEVQPKETPQEKELKELTEKMVAELRAEERLNLSMVPQLRAFRDTLSLVQNYAKKVETDIDIIQEISKDEFQEDVSLQAALFKGKKPELVAKHLEEFNAGRVGAILAKMKDKDASNVLDVWAKSAEPNVRKFYRNVMAAYLNNKRRDMNPELYDELSKEAQRIRGKD